MRLLIDTVILIDHFKNIPAATSYLREHQGDIAISAITRAEVLAGFSPSDAALAAQLLNRLWTLPVDERVADLAVALRREYGLSLIDAMQAALAKIHDLTFVTRNIRDFPPERFDFVLIPYRI
ncbi:MAG: PIN domain-containing protein [Oscillatoriaceae bacterium SKW80]|nr:PIN domain-containing protein [Oscillatoriaceae bacterium SKYG93]MCX8120856.1 PIN domain-containing protein [Oscillatoriaceae bacterium SKW80]MDW8454197.1 PIN domain-containing protein [Oscillatoriaceae cyanobacterium SKYGB_i_bin93]HIK26478.1 PIN domain-containing protein [Oscillatoriaceae cyanobacterium M7585_C2015_266]